MAGLASRQELLVLVLLLVPVVSSLPEGVVELVSIDAIEGAVASSNALLIAFLAEGCGEHARARAAKKLTCQPRVCISAQHDTSTTYASHKDSRASRWISMVRALSLRACCPRASGRC